MGCECVIDAKKNDERNDLLVKIEKRLNKKESNLKEGKLLESFIQENNNEFYSFSKQLFQYINEIRLNPIKFIQFLNTSFSHQIIPHHPPIILNDLLGKSISIEMNHFINLFNNLNSLNFHELQYIKWDENIYQISSNFIDLVIQFGYEDALQQMNLNKTICESLNGNYKCTENILTGLFDLNISSTMVLLDPAFFSIFMKNNFHAGAISCTSHDNNFYFMITIVERIRESSEISLDDPIFKYIGFKNEIKKAYVLRKEECRYFVRFFVKDGSIIEEYINY